MPQVQRFAGGTGMCIRGLFDEKLEQRLISVGEWDVYLHQQATGDLPLLESAAEEFFCAVLEMFSAH